MKCLAAILVGVFQLASFGQTKATHLSDNRSTPEAVVSALYRAHDHHQSPFFQTKSRARLDSWFVKSTADLIWKDATTSKGEVGALDGDPLYDAQDIKISHFLVGKGEKIGDQNQVQVTVTFTNLDEKRKLLFILEPTGSTWKVADINYGEGRLLTGMLKAQP